MADDETSPELEIGVMIANYLTVSADFDRNLLRGLWEDAQATVDAIRDGVEKAILDTIRGGTTAEYERMVRRIWDALSPDHERVARYRERLGSPAHQREPTSGLM